MMREKAGRNRTRLIFQRLKRAIYLGGERKHALPGRSREAWMSREARAAVAAERGNGVNPSALLLVCRKGRVPGGWLPAIWNGSLDSVKENTLWDPVFLWPLSREAKTAGFAPSLTRVTNLSWFV